MARSIRKGPYVDPSLLEKIAKVKVYVAFMEAVSYKKKR